VILRDYQQKGVNDIYTAWRDHRNVLFVLSPKTVTLSHIIHEFKGYSCVVAHRQELVMNLSLALCEEGVNHDIIAPDKIIKCIVAEQVRQYGKRFYRAGVKTTVGSIQSLKNKAKKIPEWFDRVGMWIIDEAHHCQKKNTWGTVATLFKNAYGLGVTGTAQRANGAGLGSWNDGIFDVMVESISYAELMERGCLSKYKIFAPLTHIELLEVKVSKATGDYISQGVAGLEEAMKNSSIIGDVVTNYFKFAKGKKTIVFATSVEAATNMANNFTLNGVKAVVLHADCTTDYRTKCMRDFRAGRLDVIVNVDILGEGVDVPGVECVMFARPTQSLGLYMQQLGRTMRPFEGKEFGLIIDLVGNVIRHGLPDEARVWSLERRERASKAAEKKVTPVRGCPACTAVYEAYLKACPECGHVVVPATRSEPEAVVGELAEMSKELLDKLRARKERANESPEEAGKRAFENGASYLLAAVTVKNQRRRVDALSTLKQVINLWSWLQKETDKGLLERMFFLAFGIDVESAQSLQRPDAINLTLKISEVM